MSDQPTPDLSAADFAGKMLLVYTRDRDLHHPLALRDCRFEIRAGRVFLVGRDVPRGHDAGWTDGLLRGVAWDAVAEYLVFDSIEEYRNRLLTPDEGF